MAFRDAVRRIRNALGHGNLEVIIPEEITEKDELFTKTTFTFRDKDKNGDYFEATLRISEVICLVKKIHSLIYSHVKSKCEKDNKNE